MLLTEKSLETLIATLDNKWVHDVCVYDKNVQNNNKY